VTTSATRGFVTAGKTTAEARGYRATIVHFRDDPSGRADAAELFDDGLLVVERGHVVDVGPAAALAAKYPGLEVVDYRGKILVPGFVDTHVHYPQTEMMGAYGEELLAWLEAYTFPTERAFVDKEYARSVATVFLRELLRNGTTSALVFATVHKGSVEALFEEAEKLGMRIITGKVLMDRHAPDDLCDTPESGYRESRQLIEAWHKRGRLGYAVSPRFAATSSPAQLREARRLLEESDCHMQTHVAENKREVAWVEELFRGEVPAHTSYLGVYDHFGLLTERAVLAHGVHLADADFALLAARGSALSFCPTSNLFLGSGLFRLDFARAQQVKVGLGTDIGAGTSFSLLQTLNEAYKVVKLQGGKLSALSAFYLATLGSARALALEDQIGSLLPGREADFVVLDPAATPLLAFRSERATTLEEKLFVLITLGDDRCVRATYVAGALVHDRDLP
jgi:guanine deaminase